MPNTATLDRDLADRLRAENYNAELLQVLPAHDDLAIFRVLPDNEPPHFEPGQYTVLGLGAWEPRVADVQDEDPITARPDRLLRRAYSFSCPMLDAAGNLTPPQRCPWLEFYVVLVREGEEHPPGLTPRLFGLQPGDRLFVGSKVTGHYTLAGVQPDDTVVMLSTGTGEAPHNAMVAHLLDAGHRGPILCVTCVRYRVDLGYRRKHRQLAERFDNYQYLTLTTREAENLDDQIEGFVGHKHLQQFVASGELEQAAEVPLDPNHTHVFLCGNPAMIGAPRRGTDGTMQYPDVLGMIEVLERRGFHMDTKAKPGNIHFEKYW